MRLKAKKQWMPDSADWIKRDPVNTEWVKVAG